MESKSHGRAGLIVPPLHPPHTWLAHPTLGHYHAQLGGMYHGSGFLIAEKIEESYKGKNVLIEGTQPLLLRVAWGSLKQM